MNKSRLSRRKFLKGAGCAAASALAMPYVITSSALGKGSIPAASERVTVGHIGVGGRGGDILKGCLQLDDVQSVAVCDAFRSRRLGRSQQIDRFYADKFGKGAYSAVDMYSDFRELLARDDIDAVVIATPDHWHVPIAIAAANAGKDMYVEKPLSMSIGWSKVLREAINRQGRIFQYGTQQRSGRNFRFACEIARNELIGKVHTIHVWCQGSATGGSTVPIPVPDDLDYDMWIGPARWSPYTADRCTSSGTYYVSDNCLGFIAGWGAHPLDICQWGNNTDNTSPIEYSGSGEFPTEGLYDTSIRWDVHCKYANGVKMHFMSTEVAKPIVSKYREFNHQGTTFIGDKGWVSVDRRNIYASSPSVLQAKLNSDDIHLPVSKSHEGNFIECVKDRKPTLTGIESAIRSDTISHLSDIVIRTGRSIKWDPVNETIIGDAETSRLLNRPMRSPWHL